MNEWSAAGKVQSTWNERERTVQGTNGPRRERSAGFIRSRERKFPGTNVPGNEWSRERKFHYGNECSRERIVLRTNIPAFKQYEHTKWDHNFLLSPYASLRVSGSRQLPLTCGRLAKFGCRFMSYRVGVCRVPNLRTLVFRFLKLRDHVRPQKYASSLDELLPQIWLFEMKRVDVRTITQNGSRGSNDTYEHTQSSSVLTFKVTQGRRK